MRTSEAPRRGRPRRAHGFLGAFRAFRGRAFATAAAGLGAVAAAAQCNSPGSAAGTGDCQLTDQNGTSGGSEVVDLTVDDTAFSVGGPHSGSTSPNITIENASTVTLTLFNTGTRPHDLKIQCQPPSADNCEMTWCFPPDADVPPVAPGASATTVFTAPFQEGAYPFTSDADGDIPAGADGGTTSLQGEFVLM